MFQQTREPDPDYSNEEERKALAEALLDTVPDLIAMDPVDAIVEACARVGFNGHDDACLSMLARRTGRFPMGIVREELPRGPVPVRYTVRLGWADEALASPRSNADFWEDDLLVDLARRIAAR
ncbi:MAG: hypothetical protein JJU07_16470 [Natronohydrobacter sp.]|nr:hypothetical protein [Natronohydrobacter sp.]